MVSIESFYRINDLVPSAAGYFPVFPRVCIRKAVCIVSNSLNKFLENRDRTKFTSEIYVQTPVLFEGIL